MSPAKILPSGSLAYRAHTVFFGGGTMQPAVWSRRKTTYAIDCHSPRGKMRRCRRRPRWQTEDMSKLRILLGDDHTVVRQGLRKIVEAHEDWGVVGEAADGREVVRLALALEPDVAILDIAMPLLSGIEATRQIVRRLPNIGVLILSMHSDEAYVTSALQAGARGYLLKDSADTDLIRGVTAVSAGKSFFSPAAAKVMLDDYLRRLAKKGIVDRYEALSEREREVFQLVAEGYSNKNVAEMLSISVATVETHRSHILQKLDVHSTAELVLYAVRRGVIA